jgi:hypothetical protein
LDLEEYLGTGVSPFVLQATQALQQGNFLTNNLIQVGSIHELDFVARRGNTRRYAFNKNCFVAFQVTPGPVTYDVTANRVMLKRFEPTEQLFNFLPSDLILQAMPFILRLYDAGDATPDTEVQRYIFGCWFRNSRVHYDATSRDDVKMIQSIEIDCGQVLTIDPSNGGQPSVQVFNGVAQMLSNFAASQLGRNVPDTLISGLSFS